VKKKTCVICEKLFEPKFSTTQKVCSPVCAIDLTRQKEKKRKVKEARKQLAKDRERIKTLSEWTQDAQKAFNKYIRLRDKHEVCISCQRLHSGQYHAGHYRSTKAEPSLRFVEENCSKQCSPCNTHLSGNIVDYRINLINKIGLERVEWLEGKHEPKYYRIDDLKAIRDKYREKAKLLK